MTMTIVAAGNDAVWQSVAQRAYAIWEDEGRPHGRDFDHWLRAEAEIATTTPARRPSKRAPAKPRTPTRTRKRDA